MAERIAEDKINEIRQAIDIVDVISEHVQLKKQGRNYFGLCPFHGENTPSFSVSSDKQIYHCFGCGAGGNAFSFLMDLEGISFQEAAVKLAEKANIPLQIDLANVKSNKEIPKDNQLMLEAHDLLRKFYHHLLVNTKDGQHALEYLLERGFTKESIEKFQIGYALNSWDFVTKFLSRRGFTLELMEKAGLVVHRERDDTYFDRFRDRIMFPVFDRNGATVAFSGRILSSDGDEPKYLNSPETAIFHKSNILYNFHLARPKIRKHQQVVLFEGFADVIAADRSDVAIGVASMGTSLTDEHIQLIRQNAQSVIICYDSDNAGIEAAYRAGKMLTDAGCQVKVGIIPSGLDPDDYIKQYGPEKFRQEIIEASITFMSFKLRYFRRGKNLLNEGDRLLYIEEVLKEIAKLDKVIEKDHYLRQLANEFSLSLDVLKQQESQLNLANNSKQHLTNNKGRFKQERIIMKPSSALKPAFHNAERCLIAHMLRDCDLAYKVKDMLQGNTFNIDEHQAIITYLYGFYEEGHEPDPAAFLNYIQDDKLKRVITDIEMMSINEEISEQELADYIKQVLNYQKLLKIREKQAEQKEAERQSDYGRAAVIAMEIIRLQKLLK